MGLGLAAVHDQPLGFGLAESRGRVSIYAANYGLATLEPDLDHHLGPSYALHDLAHGLRFVEPGLVG